jgi:hypothetical protein
MTGARIGTLHPVRERIPDARATAAAAGIRRLLDVQQLRPGEPCPQGIPMFFRKQSPRAEQLGLRFGTAPRARSGGSVVSPAKLLRQLDDHFDSPQQLLKEARFQIRGLSHATLSPGKRLKLAAALQKRLWPTLAAARDALRKTEDGVPEPPPQRELLDMVDQSIDALCACYQLVVEADYRVDERHGRAEQGRILEAATRVLELTHLRQRLRALRYQPMPPGAWQTVNTLFCVLCRAGAEDTPVPALCDDRLLLDSDGSTRPLRIYRLIQAFGLFDCFGWSRRRQRFLDSYCTALPEALVITYLPKVAVGGIVRFTHAHHDGPPRRAADPGSSHRILIDCNLLAEAVRRDKDGGRQQLRQDGGPTANCLAGLPPLARRPILRAMLRSLEHGVPPHAPEWTEQHRCDFRLLTGLEGVTRHLHTIFTNDPTKKAQLLRNTAFAGCSASQGDDAATTAGSEWLVLQNTDQHTVVRTRETQYTRPIALGGLALYGIGDEGFLRPTLGEVARIVRLDEQQIIVGLTHRARFATPVQVLAAVSRGDADASTAQVPCLLAYDDELGWCVISSARSSLPVGCPIEIRTRRLRVTTRLRRLRAITPHFMLFELDAMQPRLGIPSYPSTRRRHRHSRIVMTSHLRGLSEPTEELRRSRRRLG